LSLPNIENSKFGNSRFGLPNFKNSKFEISRFGVPNTENSRIWNSILKIQYLEIDSRFGLTNFRVECSNLRIVRTENIYKFKPSKWPEVRVFTLVT